MKKENFRKLFAATGTITSVADVESTLTKIVNWMFGIFWIIAAGVIIWAAFTFLTAGGSDEKNRKSQKNSSLHFDRVRGGAPRKRRETNSYQYPSRKMIY